MKYPKVKLLMLSDYTGKLNNDVFHYLDTVKIPERHVERLKSLPEPHINIANDLKKVMDLVLGTKDKKLVYEEFMKLHKKYPNAGFDRSAKIIGEDK